MKTIKIISLFLIAAFIFSCRKDICDKPGDKCIDKSKICDTCVCPDVYDPVCGCDGKTYSNECYAKIAGVKSWTKGACDINADTSCIDSSLICLTCPITTDVNPVCGCDGKTYGNPMTAQVYGGVKSWTMGPCNTTVDTSCIDSSKICITCFCPSVYDPVCGCDGKTYGNACEAQNAGVKSWTPGTCK